MAESWDEAPFVQQFAPACPHCRSVSHVRIRTYNFGDGSYGQKRICSDCSGRFWLIIEPAAAPIGQSEESSL